MNAGVYVLDPIVFKYFNKSKSLDMVTLIKDLSKKSNKILAFPAYEYWADIGRPKDFFKVNKRLN